MEHIVGNHFLPSGAGRFGCSSITVARKIDDVPLVVDEEVVDELGFAGFGTGFR